MLYVYIGYHNAKGTDTGSVEWCIETSRKAASVKMHYPNDIECYTSPVLISYGQMFWTATWELNQQELGSLIKSYAEAFVATLGEGGSDVISTICDEWQRVG